MDTYKVIGIMSGTSLDGLDITYCILKHNENGWSYNIETAATIPYSSMWYKTLKSLNVLNIKKMGHIDKDYGRYIGSEILRFIEKNNITDFDLIASHGHTVAHMPEQGITIQIGDGQEIANIVGKLVISDFRTADVTLGGQGAPLVPIGDEYLFGNYDYCLNLGGFANISYKDSSNKRIAFDICPVNTVLNELSYKHFKVAYDTGGAIAETGKVDEQLLISINSLSYYNQPPPKSLGKEWLEKFFLPIIHSADLHAKDNLATITEHIAIQIGKVMIKQTGNHKPTLFITGGGTFNTYLLNRIRKLTESDVIVPDQLIVNFKEALIFALLGVLKLRGEINCLSSVTGASADSCCGVFHQP